MFLSAAVPCSGMPTARSHPTCSMGQPLVFIFCSNPTSFPSGDFRHTLPDPQPHVTLWVTPEAWSPLHGICLLVSHRVLPHLAAHQAHLGSAERHCQGLHLLPVHGEMSCQLPWYPQLVHLL